jgi:hypothetical protein
MEHPQIGEASLPTTVKPLWVPPIMPYCALLLNYSLSIIRLVDGAETLETVYEWGSALGEWVEYNTMTVEQARLLASYRWGYLKTWMLHNPFESEAEGLNPWASRLSGEQIRLFAMELDDKDAITGTLLAFDRGKGPQYTALSYVCGQGNCDREIYVNGGRFCVKPNLLASLKQLKSYMICRLRDEATSPRDMLCWVWVDAMSINQEDATEKAEQIGKMHHVYQEAPRVAVCLGYFGSDFGCVARFLRWAKGVRHPEGSPGRGWTQFELVEQLREFDVSPGNLRQSLDCMRIDLENLGHSGTEEVGYRISKEQVLGFEESSVIASPIPEKHVLFEKLFDIMEHEWFSRLWTYQEYCLAFDHSRLEFLLEDLAIPWNTFMDVLMLVINPVRPIKWKSTSMLLRSFKILRQHVPEPPVHHHSSGGVASLWTLLETSCQRRVTVAGDHVFAVIGLMEPEIRSHIIIDYSRSDASIFSNAFEFAINHEGDGLGLARCWESLALIPSITPGLPSWCPDLNNEYQLGLGRNPWVTFSERIPAIYDKFANMRVSPSEKSLHLRVMKADVVAQVVGVPCPSIDAFSETVYQSRLN